MAANEVKRFERRVGPDERPAMAPVNGHAGKFAPEGMTALGAEGPMRKAEPGNPRLVHDMELRTMW